MIIKCRKCHKIRLNNTWLQSLELDEDLPYSYTLCPDCQVVRFKPLALFTDNNLKKTAVFDYAR